MNAHAYRAVALLALEDGLLFSGYSFGAPPLALTADVPPTSHCLRGFGEAVINTAMTGYPEALTDRSYRGQVLVMTAAHVGNYGIRHQWSEARPPVDDADAACDRVVDQAPIPDAQPNAFIIRDLYRGSCAQAPVTLDAYLAAAHIPGLYDVDTRALTLHIRSRGALLGAIVRPPAGFRRWQHYTAAPVELLKRLPADYAAALRDYLALLKRRYRYDLVNTLDQSDRHAVTAWGGGAAGGTAPAGGGATDTATSPPDAQTAAATHAANVQTAATAGGTGAPPRVLLYDCGCKRSIIACMQHAGATVAVIPHTERPERIMAYAPDLLLLSNGPGDPAPLAQQVATIVALIGLVPMLAICMGHQLLAQALGAKTYKLPFGHHGVNHPVSCSTTDRLYVTSQNHEYAVDDASLPDSVAVWFRNTNDNTIEGLIDPARQLYAVQFHPEAAPGPHDTRWIFSYVLQRIAVEA